MISKTDEVFKKVLNDRDIFDAPYDMCAQEPIPKLFEGNSWKELGRLFNEGRKGEFILKIDSRIREIENQEQSASKWRHNKIKNLKRRAEWLKLAFDNKPNLLKDLFENLEWYGLVESKLPKRMENYGKVIERYSISIAVQYFVDKIKRTPYPQNRALEKLLGYVKELYNNKVSLDIIAYFVKKINSLTKYWEVIRCVRKTDGEEKEFEIKGEGKIEFNTLELIE